MLSRSADNLYWMSRYIERAENIARILETSSQFLLDLGQGSRQMDNSGWRPILEVLCVDEDFDRIQKQDPELGILQFLSISKASCPISCSAKYSTHAGAALSGPT